MTRQLLAFSRMQVLQPRVLDLNAVVADMGKMLPRLIGENIEYTFQPAAKLSPVKADPGQIEQVILNLVVNSRDAMPNGGKISVRTTNVELSEAEASQAPADASRAVRAAFGDRQRARNGRENEGAHLRAVFHHQGSGQRNRSGPGDGVRRRQTERRLHLGGKRDRERHDFRNLSSAGCGKSDAEATRSQSHPPCRAAARRFWWSKTNPGCANSPANF